MDNEIENLIRTKATTPMRRKHCEITNPAELERILAAATIGRMASIGKDGYPYITPVNFVYDQGCIYFHCALKGEKLDNIARNARVLANGARKAAALNALVAKHEPGRSFKAVEADLPACKACAVVEIKPRSMTGKSDLAQNKTPEERLAIARYLKKRNRGRDLEAVAAMGFDPDQI